MDTTTRRATDDRIETLNELIANPHVDLETRCLAIDRLWALLGKRATKRRNEE